MRIMFDLRRYFLILIAIGLATCQKPSIWGFSTSASQIEGAWNISKGLDVWDVFTHGPDAPTRFGNKDIAADHYHRFKQDFELMRSLNARAYRFSFAWSRIFPNCTGTVNQDAVEYYHELIDAVIAAGAIPIGTMYHWDLPQACQDRYGGWTNKSIVSDFANYALTLADNFSDKIKFWLTLNEPSPICFYAYSSGMFAPGVKMGPAGEYSCAYHSMLAHASAVDSIRKKHPNKGLKFSLPIVSGWAEPLNPNNPADLEATKRALEYSAAWYLDPFFFGDYPASMLSDPAINSYMPRFTDSERELLRGSVDFICLNYYTSSYVSHDGTNGTKGHFGYISRKNGRIIGAQTGIEWQNNVAWGLRKVLAWLAGRYKDTEIWISELGYAGMNEANLTRDQIVNDTGRIHFLETHLDSMMDAIVEDKVPVKAVLVWSLLDNWEWQYAYGPRFGVVAVDYQNQTLERTIKSSGFWLSNYFSTAPPIAIDLLPNRNSTSNVSKNNASNTSDRNSAINSPTLTLASYKIFFMCIFSVISDFLF